MDDGAQVPRCGAECIEQHQHPIVEDKIHAARKAQVSG
jgi:hypothetical protein